MKYLLSLLYSMADAISNNLGGAVDVFRRDVPGSLFLNACQSLAKLTPKVSHVWVVRRLMAKLVSKMQMCR